MKLRDKLCILMLAAMLAQLLAACHVAAPAEVSGTPDASNRPVQSHGAGGSKGPADSEEPSPEPSEEVSLWDPEHRLDVSFTPAKGLELPVSGATGYASVELPLWEELPEEDEGKLATIYAPPEPEPTPEPTDEPTEEPTDEPSPAPSVSEPDPAEEEPGPEESSGDPIAVQSDDTPPAAETEEPAPTESAENESASPVSTEEIFIDPTAEPTSESTLEPDPESTPTSDSEPEPEPEPEPTPDPLEDALLVLEPGTAFVILSESGDWWQVRVKEGETGWVEHRYCLINLPDVIPSMIYNDTNAYSSVFVSSGKRIPNITGKALYQAKAQNNRLGRKEFMMPVLYAMAKNICQAQQNALAEGNTIVLYEGYRPTSAQMAVARNLSALARNDSEVKAGISTSPWNISWFIATGVSNHQQGYAMDVSLAKVTQAHVETIGGYNVIQVDQYEEYTMPTPIHELSMAAATYTRPVAIFSNTAWRTAKLTPAMSANQPALALQRYCTEAKLTPLASEWWHFNDLSAYGQTKDYSSSGNYEIRDCLSAAP